MHQQVSHYQHTTCSYGLQQVNSLQVALLLLDEWIAWVIAFTVLRVIARFLNAYNVLKPAIAWCGDWGGRKGAMHSLLSSRFLVISLSCYYKHLGCYYRGMKRSNLKWCRRRYMLSVTWYLWLDLRPSLVPPGDRYLPIPNHG